MVENKLGDITECKQWFLSPLSLLYTWVLPIFLWLTPKIDERGGLFLGLTLIWCFIGGLIVYFNRRSPWSVHVWVPLLAAPITLFLISLAQCERNPSTGPGGPLDGIGPLIGLIYITASGALFVLTIFARPLVYRPINLTCAILNALLALFALPAAHAHSTRLEIHLTLLDRSGSPVPEANIAFKRYRYGPEGRHIYAESKGPFLTDRQGSATLPTRRMRHETQLTISKLGYRKLQLALQMQYHPDEKERRIILSTEETQALATLYLPATEPLPITLILPPSDEAPDPNLKRIHFRSARDSSPLAESYLDIETGTLSRDITKDSDLELEVTGSYSETTLRLKGLGGTLLTAVDSEKPETYEAIYRIAPKDGYTPEIEIKRPGSTPPRFMVYLRLPSGTRYASMSITADGDGVHNRVRFDGQIHINESGTRFLE